MPSYSDERRAAVMQKLLPPHSRPVAEVAAEEGISEPTLYTWRKQARERGLPAPDSGLASDAWSAEAKFAVLVETAGLNEQALSEYCREKGLYPTQIGRWRQAGMNGLDLAAGQAKRQQAEQQQDKKTIKSLERELRHKEKALAEAAALLVLRKKLHALWEDSEAG